MSKRLADSELAPIRKCREAQTIVNKWKVMIAYVTPGDEHQVGSSVASHSRGISLLSLAHSRTGFDLRSGARSTIRLADPTALIALGLDPARSSSLVLSIGAGAHARALAAAGTLLTLLSHESWRLHAARLHWAGVTANMRRVG